MLQVNQLKAEDIEAVSGVNNMLALCLKWNGAYHLEDAVVARLENGIVGVAALSWDCNWYYLNRAKQSFYTMKLDISIKEDHSDAHAIKMALFQAIRKRFQQYQSEYSGKDLRIKMWCEDTDKDNLEELLEFGFIIHGVTPVLSFDLTKEIPMFHVQEPITVGIHCCDEDGLSAYLSANEQGFDGIQDGEDDLRFKLCDENTQIISVMDGSQVVSSCTVWKISETCCATENIFTIPAYRRQGLARAAISEALQYERKCGYQEAMLTVLGTNADAIRLYFSIGYRLKYSLYEMHLK